MRDGTKLLIGVYLHVRQSIGRNSPSWRIGRLSDASILAILLHTLLPLRTRSMDPSTPSD